MDRPPLLTDELILQLVCRHTGRRISLNQTELTEHIAFARAIEAELRAALDKSERKLRASRALCDAHFNTILDLQGGPVHQWRRRDAEMWQDTTEQEAYARVDDHYEARTLYTAPPVPVVDQTMQGMADCMDMVRRDLVAMGIIDQAVAPMFIPEAVARHVTAATNAVREEAAKICDSQGGGTSNAANNCAKMIRALKSGAPASVPNDHAATQHRLQTIIACAYQIAGVHGVPAHILDVLSDPLAASAAQVEAMLPYQPASLARQGLTPMQNEAEQAAGVICQWYFDCDGHYIDVAKGDDGKYSILFKDRASGQEAWLDQADELDAPQGDTFTLDDPDLNELLNLVADTLKGRGNMDTALLFMTYLARVQARLTPASER